MTYTSCKENVEEAINNWLAGVGDRDGGRRIRQETTIESLPHPDVQSDESG